MKIKLFTLKMLKLIFLSLSILQLSWFIETVKDLNKKSTEDYFYKKEKVECGRVEASKFRSKSGWVLRCIAWPRSGGRSFISTLAKINKGGKVSEKCWETSRTSTTTISGSPPNPCSTPL